MKIAAVCFALFVKVACYHSGRVALLTSASFNDTFSDNDVLEQAQSALYLLRSAKLTYSASADALFSLYFCYSGVERLPPLLRDAFSDIKVSIHHLKALPPDVTDRGDDSFLRLRCSMQIADHLYRREIFAVLVVYIHHRYLVARDLLFALESDLSGAKLRCAPPQLPLHGSVCDWNLFIISSDIGTPMQSYFLASLYQKGLTPSDLFVSAAGALSVSFDFLSPFLFHILRGNKVYHWDSTDMNTSAPLLINFDGSYHAFYITKHPSQDMPENSCVLHVHLEFNMLTSVETLTSLMSPFYEPAISRLLGGCDAFRGSNFEFIRPNHLLDFGDTAIKQHKQKTRLVYDTFLFNDELSMLALRFEVLKDVVDFHVLIESSSTFTGMTKPLYFNDSSHLFGGYSHKILHIVLLNPLNASPKESMDVWNNEYHSRNSAIVHLNKIAKIIRDDDIIIVADVDEIPHPDAIRTLQSYYRHENSPESARAYTFKVDTYLYSFNCFLPDKVLQFPQVSASTLRVARQLAKTMNRPDEPATSLRYNHKYEIPQPFNSLIVPGGWHLSFFMNMDRIKRKLDSYSHQNFREQYTEVLVSEPANGLHATVLSTEKLWKKISAGESLGTNKLANKCSNYGDRPEQRTKFWSDEYTNFVRQLWESKYSTYSDIPLEF